MKIPLHRLAWLGLAAVTGCSPSFQASSLPRAQNAGAFNVGKIDHVIFIVQEGRSFDNLFQGYPGADTVSDGKLSDGKTIELRPLSLKKQVVIGSEAEEMFEACDGRGKIPGTHCRMDGFDREKTFAKGIKYPQYTYVAHDDSKPYFAMAHEWVLGDKMFASQLDGDFAAHQYIIAAQAGHAVDIPYGFWGCNGGPGDKVPRISDKREVGGFEAPCFDYRTLGGELTDAGLSWRFYTSKYGRQGSGEGSFWSSYSAIAGFIGSNGWREHIVTPQKRFFLDVAAGKLANFTWITPICPNSDHPNCGGGYGPSWVAALVNAVGKSKFWDSTGIFVQWDDWGGLYDHVPPKYKNYDSLGFRVPLLVISPYARRGYVSHTHYETASVLTFAEGIFGLPAMAAADKRANDPAGDCFDFTQKPRAFERIPAPYGEKFFLHQKG